jgi:hypothetical protein
MATGIVYLVQRRATDWMACVPFPAGARDFFIPQHSDQLWGSHPASYPMGIVGSFPGREADIARSWPPASSAEVMNGEAIPPLPHTSSCRSP